MTLQIVVCSRTSKSSGWWKRCRRRLSPSKTQRPRLESSVGCTSYADVQRLRKQARAHERGGGCAGRRLLKDEKIKRLAEALQAAPEPVWLRLWNLRKYRCTTFHAEHSVN